MMTARATTLSLASFGAAAQTPWSVFAEGLAPGEDIVIPAGDSVLFDAAYAEVGELRVMGELIFEDDEDIDLFAERIMVMGSGALLRAGTPSEPFRHNLTITLTETIGDPAEQPMMGCRVLGTMNGASLQLHGASAARASWTQLAAAPMSWRLGVAEKSRLSK